MQSKMVTGMILCNFLFLAILFRGISCTALSYVWITDSLWTDKVTTVSPRWTLQQVTLTECSMICLSQVYCESFFYNSQTLQCHGHNNQLTVTAGSTLANGWSYYTVPCHGSSEYTYIRVFNTCYKVFMQALPWIDANNICIADGGNMINLPDINKYNYFVNLLKSDPAYTGNYWIGLTDLEVEGTFVWTETGEIFDNFSPLWRPNEPGLPNQKQNCVQIVANDYRMDDYGCKRNLPYICEKPL